MTKDTEDFLGDYTEFVHGVMSDSSSFTDDFIKRIKELEKLGINPAMLSTAGIGLAAEAGEVAEIIKKVLFQGKPMNEATKLHLKKEAGDVCWYLAALCLAINIDLKEVFDQNIEKLLQRYPEGVFSVDRSEKRSKDDI